MLRGESASFAQAWQDWVVFHHYFQGRHAWGDGFYIDIGTNDPIRISNTLFFDKCLGWGGLCIEAQAMYHEPIRRDRGCTLVPHCVLDREEVTSMHGAGGSASIVRGPAGDASGPPGPTMSCLSMKSVLEQHNVTSVDLVSIDIEGSEPSVLSCVDFNHFTPTAVLIETNKAVVRDVDMFFHRRGYSNVETFLTGEDVSTCVSGGCGPFLDNLYVRKDERHLWAYPTACGDSRMAGPCSAASRNNWGWNMDVGDGVDFAWRCLPK